MNSKDFQTIAGILYTNKKWGVPSSEPEYRILCENFANNLVRKYKNFNYKKFLSDCGL